MHQHYTFPGVKRPPSETFRQQCGATFMYEPRGLADCYKYFGPDCLYWSTDFPHPATCWPNRSEEHTSELQSLMRISYAVFCLKKTQATNPYCVGSLLLEHTILMN